MASTAFAELLVAKPASPPCRSAALPLCRSAALPPCRSAAPPPRRSAALPPGKWNPSASPPQ